MFPSALSMQGPTSVALDCSKEEKKSNDIPLKNPSALVRGQAGEDLDVLSRREEP